VRGAAHVTDRSAGPGSRDARRSRERSLRLRPLSLRAQVALVIAFLSAVPNIFMVVAVLLPAYRRAGEVEGMWLTVALWVGGVVLISGLVGYFLSGILLAPLLKASKDVLGLPRTAEQLATARLVLTEEDPVEVRSLRRSFNQLLAQVETQQARRSAFMAALMHDLKTPLVAANNLLQIVKSDDSLTKEKRVEVVGHLSNELTSLIDLVQKLVDAHRLERSDVPLNREHVLLEDVVNRVVQRLEPLRQERGISIQVSGGGDAMADARELERALYNLISNAVRYARSRIQVETYAGMVRVHDDGPGLPQPLEQLAQPFIGHDVSIGGRTYTGGTGGLGLFIARRVLEAHGGRLVCEATGPRGTVLLAFVGGSR